MPLLLNMWIGSWICFTARQPHASPPGYQSLASGDNAPDPGSQDALGAQPHHGSAPPTSSHNNNILANSTPYVSHSSTHQEVVSGHQVSHPPCAFTSAPVSNNSLAMTSWPPYDAAWSAFPYIPPCAFTSAPFSNSSFAIAS